MNNASTHRTPTVFLQAVIVLIGIGVFTFMLWEPHVEGVNADATTLAEIYFDDPFLAYAYIASIPFFTMLYRAFQLLRSVRRQALFSLRSVKDLRMIKYCAMTTIVFIAGGAIFLLANESDDRPPIIAMSMLATFIFTVIGTAAALAEKMVQKAVEIKTENDLTV